MGLGATYMDENPFEPVIFDGVGDNLPATHRTMSKFASFCGWGSHNNRRRLETYSQARLQPFLISMTQF